MKKWQWLCIILQIIGCIGMGAHLFLFDGIKNPTWVLTAFAWLFGIGLAGNLVVCLINLGKREKDSRDI